MTIINNKKAWNRLYSMHYESGGTFLPSWGVHSSGHELTKSLLQIKNKVILELGCGLGESIPYILKRNPKKYIGVDISEKAINIIKNKYSSNNISVLAADISKTLDIKSDSVDEIISIYSIGWSTDINKTLSEIYRILKTGGTFTFSWDHFLARVIEERNNNIYFQKSYNDDTPTIRYNWNQTGHNIETIQAKPSTWFQYLKNTGFEITKFYEVSTKNNKEIEHVFSSTYSHTKSKVVPFTIIFQAKKI